MKAAEEKKKKASSPSKAAAGPEVDVQPSESPTAADGQSVDRIRDIIFGPQMRDYEHRFQNLEAKLLREAEELRKHVDARFEALQNKMAEGLAALTSHLEGERKDRSEADSGIVQELHALNDALQRKMEDQGGETQTSFGQLKAQLAENTSQLSKEIAVRSEELTQRLNQEVDDLRSAKTDRATLAALLEQIAAKLQSD